MVTLQGRSKVILRHVGVALSRDDRSVTQKLLHHADVCTVPEQMRRNGMAKHVRSYAASYSSLSGNASDHAGDSLLAEPSPVDSNE